MKESFIAISRLKVLIKEHRIKISILLILIFYTYLQSYWFKNSRIEDYNIGKKPNLSKEPRKTKWIKTKYPLWGEKPVLLSSLDPKLIARIKFFKTYRQFNVTYIRRKFVNYNRSSLYRLLKQRINYRTIKYGDSKFVGNRWKDKLPLKNFVDELPKHNKCAVVVSSGSFINKSMGKEIDENDAVLRFNLAPTKSYERDVGNKTTYRVVNSMAFVAIYNKVIANVRKYETLIHFDPSKYYQTLDMWAIKPQFSFHNKYLWHLKHHPTNKVYITHPDVLWEMWKFIQDQSSDQIQPIIPSSGFIGITFMLNLCKTVHVYGYLPAFDSKYDTCYYFVPNKVQLGCLYGDYHPVLYEKNLIYRLNVGSIEDIVLKGKVTLNGI